MVLPGFEPGTFCLPQTNLSFRGQEAYSILELYRVYKGFYLLLRLLKNDII